MQAKSRVKSSPPARTSRKGIIAVLAVGLGVLSFGLLAYRVQSHSNSVSAVLRSLEFDRFDEALKQITTNEIPVLLEMLAAKDSATKTKLRELLEKAPWLRIDVKTDEAFHYGALAGFEALGSNAVSAIPQLGKILMSSEGESTSALCLAVIGHESIPTLLEALTNSNWRVRHSAASALGFMGTKGEDAIPGLLQALKDTHQLVRYSAAEALGKIKMEPQIVIPALIETLDDQEDTVKWNAAIALGKFGEKAKGAVSKLSLLAQRNDPYVSPHALEALQKIDPEAAAKAGNKNFTKKTPSE